MVKSYKKLRRRGKYAVPDNCVYRRASDYEAIYSLLYAFRKTGIHRQKALALLSELLPNKTRDQLRFSLNIVSSPRRDRYHRSAFKSWRDSSYFEVEHDFIKLHLWAETNEERK